MRVYDYGNGLKEAREFYFKENNKPEIKKHKKINDDLTVNTDTGEVTERKQPSNKSEVIDVQRGMLNEFRLLLYNINKAIPNGKVYFLTMTNRDMTDYKTFNANLDKFVKKLKYANKLISNNDFKYAFFKEANLKGRYHIHGFIWYLADEKLHLSKEIINDKWCFGTGKIEQINTSEDLLKGLMYVTNYSNKDRSNYKVTRKKRCLKFFPPGTHLVCRTKNLEQVPYIEIDEINIDSNSVFCQSKRNQKNLYYESTFYKD